MSVCVAAIMGHHWLNFSDESVRKINRAVFPEMVAPRWRHLSEAGSPEQEFETDGWVSFRLPGDFNLRLARRALSIDHGSRWSAFLTSEQVRQHFVSACKNVAYVTGAREILVVPEGTVLADSVNDGCGFDDIKERALREWGPPDLDISRICREEELRAMPAGRVHYSIVNGVNP
jgi:hypothetical protein